MAVLHLLSLLTSVPQAWAHPGMARALDSLLSSNPRQNSSSPELPADLKSLPDGALSPAGWTIKNILLGNHGAVLPQDEDTVYEAPGPVDSHACRADACCIWKYIADELVIHFRDPSPHGGGFECNELARQAVRLGFHDAGTFSAFRGGGGADGSIALSDEWLRHENRGLEGIVGLMKALYDRWRRHGAGMADLIQMGATVAAVSCPLGPRVRSFVGRRDSALPAPPDRLPDPHQDAEELVALFTDKTISLEELIALVGAHTTARQRFFDPSRAGAPQDTTPGVWDVSFYNQTKQEPPPPEVVVFPSDKSLSEYPPSQPFWTAFSNPAHDQAAWANAFAAAYLHLSLLGVKSINNLQECTAVLPLRDLGHGDEEGEHGLHEEGHRDGEDEHGHHDDAHGKREAKNKDHDDGHERGKDKSKGKGEDKNEGKGKDKNEGKGKDKNEGKGKDKNEGKGKDKGEEQGEDKGKEEGEDKGKEKGEDKNEGKGKDKDEEKDKDKNEGKDGDKDSGKDEDKGKE